MFKKLTSLLWLTAFCVPLSTYASWKDPFTASERPYFEKLLKSFFINPSSPDARIACHFALQKIKSQREVSRLLATLRFTFDNHNNLQNADFNDKIYIAHYFFTPLIHRLESLNFPNKQIKGTLKAVFREAPNTQAKKNLLEALLLTNQADAPFNSYISTTALHVFPQLRNPESIFDICTLLQSAVYTSRKLSWLAYRAYEQVILDETFPIYWRLLGLHSYREKNPLRARDFSRNRYCHQILFESPNTTRESEILAALYCAPYAQYTQYYKAEEVHVIERALTQTNFENYPLNLQEEAADSLTASPTTDILSTLGHDLALKLFKHPVTTDKEATRRSRIAKNLLHHPDPKYGKPAYEFLFAILNNGECIDTHKLAAETIIDSLHDSFHIDEEDPAFQMALDLLAKINAKEVGNTYSWDPYTAHKALMEKRNTPVIHRPVPYEELVIAPDTFMTPQPRPECPAVTHQNFVTLIDELLKNAAANRELFIELGDRIDHEEEIREQKHRTYFTRHFQSIANHGADSQVLDITTLQLAWIIDAVQKLSTKSPPGEFSPQALVMMQVMLNILTCPGGKETGIFHSYCLLRDTNNATNLDEEALEGELQKTRFVETLKGHLNSYFLKYFEGDSDFIRIITDTRAGTKVIEPGHQSLYTTKLLFLELLFLSFEGQKTMLKFDTFGGCVSGTLSQQPKQRILSTFYKYATTEKVIHMLKAYINEHMEKPVISNGIGISNIMDKEEFYDMDPVTYIPILTEKGAMALLQYYGFLVDTDLVTFEDYNRQISALKVSRG